MEFKKGTILFETTKNFTSGTVAGFTAITVGFPFDTLKVRLQTQPVHRPVYSGLTDCFMKTLQWEGVGGLYKGAASPLIGQMFYRSGLYGFYYQMVDRYTMSPGERLKTHEYFLCGAFTGLAIAFIETPIELIKTKMQIQIIRAKTGRDVQYRNIFHAGNVITKDFGVRGLYQGLGPTILRNLPSVSLYFGVFELCRNKLTPPGKTITDLSPMQLFISGGIAGFSYWVFTYPADVIKSAIQAEDSNKEKRRFKGIVDCIRKLYLEDGGWKRFYKGYTPCLLRSLPANAAMFFALEKCRQLFE